MTGAGWHLAPWSRPAAPSRRPLEWPDSPRRPDCLGGPPWTWDGRDRMGHLSRDARMRPNLHSRMSSALLSGLVSTVTSVAYQKGNLPGGSPRPDLRQDRGETLPPPFFPEFFRGFFASDFRAPRWAPSGGQGRAQAMSEPLLSQVIDIRVNQICEPPEEKGGELLTSVNGPSS